VEPTAKLTVQPVSIMTYFLTHQVLGLASSRIELIVMIKAQPYKIVDL